jgi:RNA polymerase sigma-70 factor (ECF subfamily)
MSADSSPPDRPATAPGVAAALVLSPGSGIAAIAVSDAVALPADDQVTGPPPPAARPTSEAQSNRWGTAGTTVVDDDPIPPLPGRSPSARAPRPAGPHVTSHPVEPAASEPTRPPPTGSWAPTTAAVPSDQQTLAVRARDGDADALAGLLELIDTDGSVRLPIRRLITHTQTVEDLSQDVLIIVAERIGSWDGRSRFGTWLHTVARNRAIDHLRAQRPSQPLPGEDAALLASAQRRVSSLIATRDSVRAAVAQLPKRYRIPVLMRDVDQLDYDEIAELLGVPEVTVRSQVSRGRAMVAAAWTRANR